MTDCDPEMRDRPSEVSSGIVPRLAANSLHEHQNVYQKNCQQRVRDSRIELVFIHVIHVVRHIIVKVILVIFICKDTLFLYIQRGGRG